MNGASVRIAPVSAADVRPLRSAVLRPGTPPERLAYDGDEGPDALHVAAIDATEAIVGIASLCREPAARTPQVDGWRLRGMATAPELRGQGLGARLLRECFGHVRAHGGGLLWCNARTVARGFYDRLGLEAVGAEFDLPGIGPHYVMQRLLPSLREGTVDDATRLTALALRVKSSQGYDAAEVERHRRLVEVTPALLASPTTHVVVASLATPAGPAIAGHAVLELQDNSALRLDALFVEPAWAQQGIGRELLAHARDLARSLGAETLVLDSDPDFVPTRVC